MPASEFATALSERVEFAAFIAYEQWARTVGYVADNPYDILARLLPGLNDALGAAVASRGGWGVLEPIAGFPAEAAKHLISEMAVQVVSAQVAALAPHVPGATLLVQVISAAVGHAVTVFVDDPESWRLAMQPGERAPVAVLTDPNGTSQAHGIEAGDPGGALPSAPLPPDEGTDSGGARMVQAIENSGWIRADLHTIRELWFVKTGSSWLTDGHAMLLDGVMLKLGTDRGSGDDAHGAPAEGSAGDTLDLTAGDGLIAPLPGVEGPDAATGERPGYMPRLEALPDAIASVIHAWIDLLGKAKFYHVQPDGSIQHLSAEESAQLIDTLAEVLIGRAEQNLPLPALPDGYQPPASVADRDTTPGAEPSVALAQAVPQGDPEGVIAAAADPATTGLGSGTLAFPPADPASPATGHGIEITAAFADPAGGTTGSDSSGSPAMPVVTPVAGDGLVADLAHALPDPTPLHSDHFFS